MSQPMTEPTTPSPSRELERIVSEILAAWDADRDSRVGKMLAALSGRLPGYREDIDQLLAALAGETPAAQAPEHSVLAHKYNDRNECPACAPTREFLRKRVDWYLDQASTDGAQEGDYVSAPEACRDAAQDLDAALGLSPLPAREALAQVIKVLARGSIILNAAIGRSPQDNQNIHNAGLLVDEAVSSLSALLAERAQEPQK